MRCPLPLACWDSVFESREEHECLSSVNVVLSGRGVCDGPIPLPADWVSLITDHNRAVECEMGEEVCDRMGFDINICNCSEQW
jgi:hypothetical protein